MDKPKILLVEDDEFLRELFSETLANGEFNVDTAADGEEGLNKIEKGGYDLILLDIVLPKIDGLSIMKKVKESPPSEPNKSIVFLTNLDKNEEIQEALKLGDGYLIKSQITPGDFLNEVKRYLGKLK